MSTVDGNPTVQLGRASLSVTGSSRLYLHNCHKWMRVGWIKAVALSSPLRLIVTMDRTPELHKSKIHTGCAYSQ